MFWGGSLQSVISRPVMLVWVLASHGHLLGMQILEFHPPEPFRNWGRGEETCVLTSPLVNLMYAKV